MKLLPKPHQLVPLTIKLLVQHIKSTSGVWRMSAFQQRTQVGHGTMSEKLPTSDINPSAQIQIAFNSNSQARISSTKSPGVLPPGLLMFAGLIVR